MSRRWLIVAAGGILGCVAIGALFSLPVLLRPISQDTGWSTTGISTAMTLAFVALALGSISWGYLSDRVGPRVVLLAGTVLLTAGLWLASLATSLLAFQLTFGAIVGGASLSDIGGDFGSTTRTRWGGTAGLLLGYNAWRTAVTLEGDWVQKGGGDTRLDYIEFPLTVGAVAVAGGGAMRARIYSGISFGFKVSCSSDIDGVCDDASGTEWGWPFGLQLAKVNENNSFVGLDVKYTVALSDAFDFINAYNRLTEKSRFPQGLDMWLGFRQCYVEIDHLPRADKKSSYSFIARLSLALMGLLYFSDRPIKLVTAGGFTIAVLGFLLVGAIFIGKLFGAALLPGYASLAAIALLTFGIQLTSLGLIGLYIGRIFAEVQNRPLYLIRETYGKSH